MIYSVVDGFRRPSAKKSGRQKCKPNPGEGEKREKKSGRWPNPGPSPSAKQTLKVFQNISYPNSILLPNLVMTTSLSSEIRVFIYFNLMFSFCYE